MKKDNTQEAILRLSDCARHHASCYLWEASEDAPGTYKDVINSYKEHNAIIVWNGASNSTIFSSSEGNIHFRVWHDACHIKLLVDFKPENEYLVLLEQQRQYITWRSLNGVFDAVDVIALELLRLEIYGQRVFYEKHKDYLNDQKDFALYTYEKQIELMENWKDK